MAALVTLAVGVTLMQALKLIEQVQYGVWL
jgi:hypothetical protein